MKNSKPKEVRINVRITKDQAEKFDDIAAASRKSHSEVFRMWLDGHKSIKPAPPRKSIFDLRAVGEITKQGFNINQIARELNSGDRDSVSKDDFAALDRALLQVVALVLLGEDEAKRLARVGLTDFAPYIPILPANSSVR
jgi:hypothetical protein